MPLLRMALIAALVGVVAGGLVWYLTALPAAIRAALEARAARRKEQADAAALLEQAKDRPKAGER